MSRKNKTKENKATTTSGSKLFGAPSSTPIYPNRWGDDDTYSLYSGEFSQKPAKQVLTFSLYAWAKLLFMRDIGQTEVGCFGITLEHDLFYVQDLRFIKQKCSGAHTKFDDEALNDLVVDELQAGRQPRQCQRIWIHTHPHMGADPSGTDEDTFERCFGKCDWAVMFIISKTEDTSCRLKANLPNDNFVITQEIEHKIDFSGRNWTEEDEGEWRSEYHRNIEIDRFAHTSRFHTKAKDAAQTAFAKDDTAVVVYDGHITEDMDAHYFGADAYAAQESVDDHPSHYDWQDEWYDALTGTQEADIHQLRAEHLDFDTNWTAYVPDGIRNTIVRYWQEGNWGSYPGVNSYGLNEEFQPDQWKWHDGWFLALDPEDLKTVLELRIKYADFSEEWDQYVTPDIVDGVTDYCQENDWIYEWQMASEELKRWLIVELSSLEGKVSDDFEPCIELTKKSQQKIGLIMPNSVTSQTKEETEDESLPTIST